MLINIFIYLSYGQDHRITGTTLLITLIMFSSGYTRVIRKAFDIPSS